MNHLVATAAITVLTLIGFGTIATAAWADTSWDTPGPDGLIHLPDGTCAQPGSNPLVHVECTSTAATTPATTIAFVEPPAATTPTTQPDGTWGTPSNPFPDGTCAQPGSNPPVHVDCTGTYVTTPYVAEHPYVPPTTTPVDAATPEVAPQVNPAAVAGASETSPARVFTASRQLPTTGATTTITVIVGGTALLLGAGLLLAGRRAGA